MGQPRKRLGRCWEECWKIQLVGESAWRGCCEGGGGCTWVQPGRFGSFFVLCFLALGGHCLQMLCLTGFGTHANTQNLPHFRAFPASIWGHPSPKCLFFKANAKLPNRPVFALLRGGGGGFPWKTKKEQHPRQHSPQHPEFSQQSSQYPP